MAGHVTDASRHKISTQAEQKCVISKKKKERWFCRSPSSRRPSQKNACLATTPRRSKLNRSGTDLHKIIHIVNHMVTHRRAAVKRKKTSKHFFLTPARPSVVPRTNPIARTRRTRRDETRRRRRHGAPCVWVCPLRCPTPTGPQDETNATTTHTPFARELLSRSEPGHKTRAFRFRLGLGLRSLVSSSIRPTRHTGPGTDRDLSLARACRR